MKIIIVSVLTTFFLGACGSTPVKSDATTETRDSALGEFLLKADRDNRNQVYLSLCERDGKWSVTEQAYRSAAPLDSSCMFISCSKHPIGKAPAPSNPIAYGSPRTSSENSSNSAAVGSGSITGMVAGKVDANSVGTISGNQDRMGQVSGDTVFEASPQSNGVAGNTVVSGKEPFSDKELLELKPVPRPSMTLNSASARAGWTCQMSDIKEPTPESPQFIPGATTPLTEK